MTLGTSAIPAKCPKCGNAFLKIFEGEWYCQIRWCSAQSEGFDKAVVQWLDKVSEAGKQARALHERILHPRETVDARQARFLAMSEAEVSGHLADFRAILDLHERKQIEAFQSAEAKKPSDLSQSKSHRESEVTPKKIWEETDRAFGDFIDEQFKLGNVPGEKGERAASRKEAFRVMCRRYEREDGTQFNPDSILQSLRARADKEGK